MRRVYGILVLICLLSTSSVFGAGISVATTRGSATTLEIDCSKVDFTNAKINGNSAVLVTAPDASLSFEKDAPQLPRYTAMVMVNPTRHPVFQVKSIQSEIVDLKAPVVPSRGNFTRDIDPATVPFKYGKVYTEDAWYPSDNDLVKMGKPFIFREIRGVNLVVNPVQYNPVKNQLRIHRKLQVIVTADNKPAKNIIKKASPISKVYEPIYKNVFVNFKQAATKLPRLGENGRLLIICYDDFMKAMAPFVAWKKKCGIDVKLVPVSVAGKTNTEIKAFIQDEYNQGNLTHIMLVGDAKQIPTNKGVKEGADSDPCYTKLAGDDQVPDCIISRLSAETVEQVKYQVAKFVNYEEFPTKDTAWYTKAVGIASNQGHPTDYERCNELRNALLGWNFKSIDQIYDPTATKAKIADAVNEGRSLINYIGHGSTTSWGTTRFSNTDCAKLKNGLKLPVIWSVACVNGNFVRSTCFSEAWMRAGTIENPAGAISFFGSSTNQEWVPPCVVQAEINKNLTVNEKYKTIGALAMNGIMKGLEVYGTKSNSSGVMMLEQWHLFGDGTTQYRFNAPSTVAADSSVTKNADSVTVKINVTDKEGKAVSDARVTVYTEGVENVHVATTNDNGEAVVTMPKEFKSGYMTVIGADTVPVVDQKITF